MTDASAVGMTGELARVTHVTVGDQVEPIAGPMVGGYWANPYPLGLDVHTSVGVQRHWVGIPDPVTEDLNAKALELKSKYFALCLIPQNLLDKIPGLRDSFWKVNPDPLGDRIVELISPEGEVRFGTAAVTNLAIEESDALFVSGELLLDSGDEVAALVAFSQRLPRVAGLKGLTGERLIAELLRRGVSTTVRLPEAGVPARLRGASFRLELARQSGSRGPRGGSTAAAAKSRPRPVP